MSDVTGSGRFRRLFVSLDILSLCGVNGWSIGCSIVRVYIRRSAEQKLERTRRIPSEYGACVYISFSLFPLAMQTTLPFNSDPLTLHT